MCFCKMCFDGIAEVASQKIPQKNCFYHSRTFSKKVKHKKVQLSIKEILKAVQKKITVICRYFIF